MLTGLHLIKHAAWRTLERGGQFVLLGSAPDPRIQVSRHPSLLRFPSLSFNHSILVITVLQCC